MTFIIVVPDGSTLAIGSRESTTPPTLEIEVTGS